MHFRSHRPWSGQRGACKESNGHLGCTGLSVEVQNAELPSRLRHCIAQQLLEERRAQRNRRGFGLASIFDAAAANYVSLLSSLPELVEAYQSTDTAGATVRRYAIINDDQQVPMPLQVASKVHASYMIHCEDSGCTSILSSAKTSAYTT